MSESYIATMNRYWDTSHWTICVCGFTWDDWQMLSQEQQRQFEKELQIVAKKYSDIAKTKEGNNESSSI